MVAGLRLRIMSLGLQSRTNPAPHGVIDHRHKILLPKIGPGTSILGTNFVFMGVPEKSAMNRDIGLCPILHVHKS